MRVEEASRLFNGHEQRRDAAATFPTPNPYWLLLRNRYYPPVITLVPRHSVLARWLRGVCCVLLAATARGEDLSLTNLLVKGDALSQKRETRAALDIFLQVDKLFPSNAPVQCRIAEAYCDLMHAAPTKNEQKILTTKALDYGRRAAAYDPKCAMAHVCLAVCYAKNFPFLDNQTKVNYSREIKLESEKAIELDPKYDLSYHMLGRWNCEVANMNLFLMGLVKIVYGGLPKASNDTAIQDFKKAIELAPTRIIHHLQLAHVYGVTGQKKLMTDELKSCATFTPHDMDDADAQSIAAKVLSTGKWPAEF
jgi:tetratricopeptide (TPR) repeat protein